MCPRARGFLYWYHGVIGGLFSRVSVTEEALLTTGRGI